MLQVAEIRSSVTYSNICWPYSHLPHFHDLKDKPDVERLVPVVRVWLHASRQRVQGEMTGKSWFCRHDPSLHWDRQFRVSGGCRRCMDPHPRGWLLWGEQDANVENHMALMSLIRRSLRSAICTIRWGTFKIKLNVLTCLWAHMQTAPRSWWSP